MKVAKPTLLLDETKCKNNIKRMFEKAKTHNLEFRPHFKTHQSLDIGRWFRESGIKKITVSSLSMAAYFSKEWNDITVAFPVNINEIELINELAAQITLNICVENIESLFFLKAHLDYPINVFIKVDVGYHRTGVKAMNIKLIDSILTKVASCNNLDFVGFLGHSGHTYQCRSLQRINEIHNDSLDIMRSLASRYKEKYPNLIISLGDTPSCSIVDNFKGVDEIRPGNFVFYDLTQLKIGSNTIEQIAVAMVCPIVTIHPDRDEIVIYGGGVHFSKDSLRTKEGTIYGMVVEHEQNGWGSIIEGMYIKRLSQEHGIVAVPTRLLNKYSIGDCLIVLPVHACMTANAMKEYYNSGHSIYRL